MKHFLKRSGYWILLLFMTYGAFIFVLWLLRREAIGYISLFFFLFIFLVSGIGLWTEYRRQKKEEKALLCFLENPERKTARVLLQKWGNDEGIRALCEQTFRQLEKNNEKEVELLSYREYIEAWVHEVKTPLSLHTLILNNHEEEMSPYVYSRMHHIEHQLNENVEKILFYARLQADHADYKFSRLSLEECVGEVLGEYRIPAQEKNIQISSALEPAAVVSDRKVTSFILSQLMSNAVKYADDKEGKIHISVWKEPEKVYFRIWNNGEGVPKEDVPFLFDKGFTGSHPNRQKATGMGLYLVRKYAEKLCIEAEVDPVEEGFAMKLGFSL